MKRIITTSCLLLAITLLFGATKNEKKSVFVPKAYVGIAGGASAFLGEGNTPFQSPNNFSISNNAGLGGAFFFGYNFAPVLGWRGEIEYFQNKWKDFSGNQSKYGFTSFSADLMFNLSNLLAGYNPNRVFDLQAYTGVGVGDKNDIKTNLTTGGDLLTPIFRLGLQGVFHVSKSVDLSLDLTSNSVSDKYNNLKTALFFDEVVSAKLGVAYVFPSAEPVKPAPVPVVVKEEKPIDSDGDGIPDKDDKCPNVKGVAKYQGCPVPDTDGDGIDDEHDKCPTVKGVAKYQGCPVPDTDGDGIDDEHDKCPTVPGTKENNGCPEVKKEVVQKINLTAKQIFFVTGKADLKPESKKVLLDLAKLLNDDKKIKLAINGHTDNVGNDKLNQKLSEDRAAAVKKFLVANGIDEARLTSNGYGSSQPVASNDTAAGRQQNRRVELVPSY